MEISLKSSSTSLKDELEQVHLEECDHCNLKFANKQELESHMEAILKKLKDKEALRLRLNKAKEKISHQKLHLSNSLFTLKTQEINEKRKCKCKTFCRIHFYKCDCLTYCRINHDKHNFKKPQSEEIYENLQSFPIVIDSCNQCDEEVTKWPT